MSAGTAVTGPILCLGEAIVDLVCEAELESPADAEEFRPHFGGALANVAIAAARADAPAALAGGVGRDPWGEWLRERLEAEAVDLRWFSSVDGVQTPVAFVTFDRDREPTFQVYGDGIEAGVRSVRGTIEAAVGAAQALVFGSNTLVNEPERELTLRARSLALERGMPVLFDPNIRPNRWRDLDAAVGVCREAVSEAFVVRANLDEGRLIAGAGSTAGAGEVAERLSALGARVAVVTTGPGPAVARGEAAAEAPAPRVRVASPLGAGDAFMGTLAAGLARRAWRTEGVAAVLPEAVAAGSAACERWGALS